MQIQIAQIVETVTQRDPGNHIRCDVCNVIGPEWDLMIAHPPCTHLAVSGAAFFYRKQKEQKEALEFVQMLMDAPIDHICIENPVSIISTRIRKPDQIIQPWMFGHETTKTTCLWLKGLPHLLPTKCVSKGERKYYASGRSSPMWHAKTGGGCGKKRSVTFQGVADAMAQQWGGSTLPQATEQLNLFASNYGPQG